MIQRITFQETEGSHRAYSYDYDPEECDGEVFPVGKFFFDDNDAPDKIIGECESLGQSEEAPSFLWDPDGEVVVIVENVS